MKHYSSLALLAVLPIFVGCGHSRPENTKSEFSNSDLMKKLTEMDENSKKSFGAVGVRIEGIEGRVGSLEGKFDKAFDSDGKLKPSALPTELNQPKKEAVKTPAGALEQLKENVKEVTDRYKKEKETTQKINEMMQELKDLLESLHRARQCPLLSPPEFPKPPSVKKYFQPVRLVEIGSTLTYGGVYQEFYYFSDGSVKASNARIIFRPWWSAYPIIYR